MDKIELGYNEFVVFFVISIIVYGLFSFGVAALIAEYIL
jgi:hypothetical protein